MNTMNTKLTKSDEECRQKFLSLKSRKDVADLLEIDEKTLIYLLYRNKHKNYKKFLLERNLEINGLFTHLFLRSK